MTNCSSCSLYPRAVPVMRVPAPSADLQFPAAAVVPLSLMNFTGLIHLVERVGVHLAGLLVNRLGINGRIEQLAERHPALRDEKNHRHTCFRPPRDHWAARRP